MPICIFSSPLKMKIEILSKQSIKPSSPTPPQLRDFKLSFIDEKIPTSFIPLILYYTFNQQQHNINQSEMCHHLKTSLSEALVQFYPLAGRMKGPISVDCNDEGVHYIEAIAEANILDIVKSPDPQTLDKLIPFVTNGHFSTVEEQLAVQITSFNCGGITIGICISHRIADACTLSSFIKCWAATACQDQNEVVSPVFNSAALFPPCNAPDFTPNYRSPAMQPIAPNLVTRRFVFEASAIDAMKLEVVRKSPIVKPTRVEVVTAFIWNRCVVAKGIGKSEKSFAFHPINLRGKVPALTEMSFGNLFQMVKVESAAETDWTVLVKKLRDAFGKFEVERLLGDKGFEVARENFMEIAKILKLGNEEVFRFSSYCKFAVYEADFGWGKPVWVSNSSYRNKNCMFLFDSVDSSGGIEAWIVLTDEHMERLEKDLEFKRFASGSSC